MLDEKVAQKIFRKSIYIIIICILICVITGIYMLKVYKDNSLRILEEVSMTDEVVIENEFLEWNDKYMLSIFTVKIDDNKNIIEILNNNEFGIERDLYRVINDKNQDGIAFMKNIPVRYLKKNKEYGKMIIFYNREFELNNIFLLLNRIILIQVMVGITSIALYEIKRKSNNEMKPF